MRTMDFAFRPFLTPRVLALRDELGWVAAALGEVRDLDVQIDRMDEWREGVPEERAQSLYAIDALLHE